MTKTRLPEIIARNEGELLNEWVRRQAELLPTARDRPSDRHQRASSQDFLRNLTAALSRGAGADIMTTEWPSMRDMLAEFSRQRVVQGFSPSEIAMFVLSFKQPLFARIGAEYAGDSDRDAVQDELWTASELLDKLGLYTIEIFQKAREEVILRQQQEMLELSTPVVELWSGVLALPLIGTLDSARTQIVMAEPARSNRSERCGPGHHRYNGRPDSGYACGAASSEDCRRGPPDGSRLYYQRHPPPDCPDHHSPGCRSCGSADQGHSCRCPSTRLEKEEPDGRPLLERPRKEVKYGADTDPENGLVAPGHNPGRHARPAWR